VKKPLKSNHSLSPPLKWAGGKRWLLPYLAQYWQADCRLVEPFCGGLAVALGLMPQQAMLNDANPLLINFYRQVQQGLYVNQALNNDEAFYYQARERFNQLILAHQANTAEAAVLFYYLNRTGYNGLCRLNSRGLYNVPFGRYATINYQADFLDYQKTLAGWQFSHGDFESLAIKRQDWVYADPPYDVPFTTYAQAGFDWADQLRLAHWLADLKVPVVASNQATPRILALYEGLGFRVETLDAPRRIACNGDRTMAKEMIAFKGL
jgi:DNA adenine methylase